MTAVADGFVWREGSGGRLLVCQALEAAARHLFTTRELTFLPETVEQDYERVGAVLQVAGSDVVRVRQVHARHVVVVHQGRGSRDYGEADAIVSTDPDRAISVRVADCVPVLVADREHRAVAAIHAGWRGTAAGVTTAAIEAMVDLGIAPENLVAAIGPSIGPCCYQVDAAVRDVFAETQPASDDWFTPDGENRWRLDLWRANQAQLEASGVPAASIGLARSCTFEGRRDWHSHRRDGAKAGRMVAAIRLSR